MTDTSLPVKAPLRPGSCFGRLTIIARDASERRKLYWLCRCSCGGQKSVRQDHLRTGAIVSCGCAHIEHGHTLNAQKSVEYETWINMHQRCNNSRHPKYRDYGARGIKVCARWSEFQNFLSDMGLRPSLDLSLDRIDNDRGYEPDNCRWATRITQQNNRRVSKREAA